MLIKASYMDLLGLHLSIFTIPVGFGGALLGILSIRKRLWYGWIGVILFIFGLSVYIFTYWLMTSGLPVETLTNDVFKNTDSFEKNNVLEETSRISAFTPSYLPDGMEYGPLRYESTFRKIYIPIMAKGKEEMLVVNSDDRLMQDLVCGFEKYCESFGITKKGEMVSVLPNKYSQGYADTYMLQKDRTYIQIKILTRTGVSRAEVMRMINSFEVFNLRPVANLLKQQGLIK
jgi:hypothetical protein